MKLTAREGVYYAAWMAGIIAIVPILRAQGVHHIVSLIIGVGVGYALGLAAEKAFDKYQAGKREDGDGYGGNRDDHLK